MYVQHSQLSLRVQHTRYVYAWSILMHDFARAVDIVHEREYLVLRNAKIDMYKGSMRLAVNQWGKVERTEKQDFEPKVLPEGLLCPNQSPDNGKHETARLHENPRMTACLHMCFPVCHDLPV